MRTSFRFAALTAIALTVHQATAAPSTPETAVPVDEGLGGTNGAAQHGLETIAMLGLVGDRLPAEFPPITPEEEKELDRPSFAPPAKAAPARVPAK